MTQAALAEQVELSTGYVSKSEVPKHLNVKMLNKFAKALSWPIGFLYQWEKKTEYRGNAPRPLRCDYFTSTYDN